MDISGTTVPCETKDRKRHVARFHAKRKRRIWGPSQADWALFDELGHLLERLGVSPVQMVWECGLSGASAQTFICWLTGQPTTAESAETAKRTANRSRYNISAKWMYRGNFAMQDLHGDAVLSDAFENVSYGEPKRRGVCPIFAPRAADLSDRYSEAMRHNARNAYGNT